MEQRPLANWRFLWGKIDALVSTEEAVLIRPLADLEISMWFPNTVFYPGSFFFRWRREKGIRDRMLEPRLFIIVASWVATKSREEQVAFSPAEIASPELLLEAMNGREKRSEFGCAPIRLDKVKRAQRVICLDEE